MDMLILSNAAGGSSFSKIGRRDTCEIIHRGLPGLARAMYVGKPDCRAAKKFLVRVQTLDRTQRAVKAAKTRTHCIVKDENTVLDEVDTTNPSSVLSCVKYGSNALAGGTPDDGGFVQ